MLLARPHWPWAAFNKPGFWAQRVTMAHMTIPGLFNHIGVSRLGSAVQQISQSVINALKVFQPLSALKASSKPRRLSLHTICLMLTFIVDGRYPAAGWMPLTKQRTLNP